MPQLEGANIVLGISGGIAAYKSLELTRHLRRLGANVRVVLSDGAQAFVTPISFQALSGNPVHTTLLDVEAEAAMGHIELARWADLLLIAPASANILARLAHGMADDLLTTLALATAAPLVVAPAMNQQMWANPRTQRNVARLAGDGVWVLTPTSGDQACGDVGEGRMREPTDLCMALEQIRAGLPHLMGRWLITAGPTFEDIDPVRYVGNRSSGRMGYALAHAAALAGAQVHLISGPSALSDPPGVSVTRVRSATQMAEAVSAALQSCSVFVATAAVADFGLDAAKQKIKKAGKGMNLELHANPDILEQVLQRELPITTIGFAAETENLRSYAQAKLKRKPVDILCANRVGQAQGGFETVDNALTLFYKDGREESLPSQRKSTLAVQLIVRIAAQISKGSMRE